jgi:hypothetical protein
MAPSSNNSSKEQAQSDTHLEILKFIVQPIFVEIGGEHPVEHAADPVPVPVADWDGFVDRLKARIPELEAQLKTAPEELQI